jgi:hypothetical protein
MMTRAAAGADHPPGQRVGGDLAAGADGAAVAQGMDVPAIAKVAFTSEDRVRDVIRNFNADGFGSLTRSTRAATRRSSRWPAAGDQEDRQGQAGRV